MGKTTNLRPRSESSDRKTRKRHYDAEEGVRGKRRRGIWLDVRLESLFVGGEKRGGASVRNGR